MPVRVCEGTGKYENGLMERVCYTWGLDCCLTGSGVLCIEWAMVAGASACSGCAAGSYSSSSGMETLQVSRVRRKGVKAVW